MPAMIMELWSEGCWNLFSESVIVGGEISSEAAEGGGDCFRFQNFFPFPESEDVSPLCFDSALEEEDEEEEVSRQGHEEYGVLYIAYNV